MRHGGPAPRCRSRRTERRGSRKPFPVRGLRLPRLARYSAPAAGEARIENEDDRARPSRGGAVVVLSTDRCCATATSLPDSDPTPSGCEVRFQQYGRLCTAGADSSTWPVADHDFAIGEFWLRGQSGRLRGPPNDKTTLCRALSNRGFGVQSRWNVRFRIRPPMLRFRRGNVWPNCCRLQDPSLLGIS